MVEQASISVN